MATPIKHVIIVPGIFRREGFISNIKNQYTSKGLVVEVYAVPWFSRSLKYQNLMNDLNNKVTKLSRNGRNVSLIGTSAGGSVVVNLFSLIPSEIQKVVCICSPLTDCSRILKIAMLVSPLFSESILSAKSNLFNMSSDCKNRILLIKPNFDELVSQDSMFVSGVKTFETKGVEHLVNISRVMSNNIDIIFEHIG